MKKILMAAAALTLILTSCNSRMEPIIVEDTLPFPYDTEIDETVRPGDDYYHYALGKWLDSSNPSPSFFDQISENNQELLARTLTTSSDPLLVQLRGMVEKAMADDSRSAALIKERLQMLEQVETVDQLYEAFSELHRLGYNPLVRLSPEVRYGKEVVNIMLSGGKPVELDTLMAMRDTEKVAEKVASYCQPLTHFGYSQERIVQISQNAVKMETVEMSVFVKVYDLLNTPAERIPATKSDDPYKDAVMFVGGLMGLDPALVERYMITPLTMAGFELLRQFATLAEHPELVPLFRDYMIYNVICQDAFCIPKTTAQTDRVAILANLLHYNRYYKYRILLDSYGTENIFKQQCLSILEDLRQVLIERIENLDWMSAPTKAEARKKAEAMTFYVGYPEQWNSDMNPQVDGDCLLDVATQLRQHQNSVVKNMLGRNLDEVGWDFWAILSAFTTDNAFHLREANALIILPSWITRPRFDNELSEAVTYAAAICFAHEICHGFDAGGSLADADGVKRDWWAPADKQAFLEKQKALIELFNQMEDYPGQPADGELTLNENLADYGGVTIALECYKQRLTRQGFTGEQFDEQIKKFFLAYAQFYKHTYERTVEYQKKIHDMKDSHSLNHVRINGMMRLQDDWYRLYDVQPTDKLYVAPENRVKIW